MAYTNLSDLFTGICDAIRAKKGTTGTINHQDIPGEIESIEGTSRIECISPSSLQQGSTMTFNAATSNLFAFCVMFEDWTTIDDFSDSATMSSGAYITSLFYDMTLDEAFVTYTAYDSEGYFSEFGGATGDYVNVSTTSSIVTINLDGDFFYGTVGMYRVYLFYK